MKLSCALFLLLSLGEQCYSLPYGGTKGSPPSYGPSEVQNEALTDEIGINDGSSGPYGGSETSKAASVDGPFDYEFMNTDESSAGNRGKERLTLGVETEGSGVDTPYVPGHTDQASENDVAVKVPQSDQSSWFNDLAIKWDFIKDKTREGAKSLGNKIQSVYETIQSAIPQLWKDFKAILANFGRMVHRGAEYVVQKISNKYEETEASQLITRLKERLDQGEETVVQFFESVGQKATQWMQEHDRANIDDGLFQENKEFSQHFSDPTFPDLFQDKEVQAKLERMVGAGVISQNEMDLLCQKQEHDIPNEEIFPIQLDSGITSNQNENLTPDTYGNLGGPLENILIGGIEPLDQQKETVYGNASPVDGQPEIEIPLTEVKPDYEVPVIGNDRPVDVLPDTPDTFENLEGLLESALIDGIESLDQQKEPVYDNYSPVDGQPEVETPLAAVKPADTLDTLENLEGLLENTLIGGTESLDQQKEPVYDNYSPVDRQPEVETPLTVAKPGYEVPTIGNDRPVDILTDESVGTTYGNEGTSVDQLKQDVPPGTQLEELDFGTKPQTDIIVDKYSDNTRGNESPLVEEPNFTEVYNDGPSGNADATGIHIPEHEQSTIDLDVLPTQNVEPHHTIKKELLGPGAPDQQKQSKSDVLFEPDYQDYLTVPKESNNNEGAAIYFPDNW